MSLAAEASSDSVRPAIYDLFALLDEGFGHGGAEAAAAARL